MPPLNRKDPNLTDAKWSAFDRWGVSAKSKEAPRCLLLGKVNIGHGHV